MAALKNHFCFCSSGLKRFESKDGRGFVRCRTETCTLFVAEEKYTELVEVFQTKVHNKYKPNNFPLCECDEVCSFWVSHSTENPGRPFFRCQETDKNEKCDFFAWADQVTKTRRKRACDGTKVTKKVTKSRKKMKRVKPLDSSDDDDEKKQSKIDSYSVHA
jgi:hypothetical protein